MFDLRLYTPPAAALLDRDAVKQHLSYDDADQDALIDGLIAAVTARLDGFDGILRRCLITQTWLYSLPAFPRRGAIEIPLPPLQRVVEITYLDIDGQVQTLDASLYVVHDEPLGVVEAPLGVVFPPTLPGNRRAVTIKFTAGYGDAAAAVPAPIRQAALLLTGDLFANRESGVIDASRVTSVENPAFKALLAPYRIPRT
jgi:uncharacterized phiE125 gp8 family phage protein